MAAMLLAVVMAISFLPAPAGAASALPADHPLFALDCRPDGSYDTETRLQQLETWRDEAGPETPELHGLWLYCRAAALERSGELDQAYLGYSASIDAYARLPAPAIGAVRALLDRSYIDYLRSNDPTRYCPDRTEALRLAREIGDSEALIAALNHMAFCFTRQPEQLAQGLALLEEAVALAETEDIEPGQLGMIHNATANLYQENQLLEPALTHLELAYQAWSREDDRQDMFNMLHGLIQTSTRLGRWEDAERHLARMRELTAASPEFGDFPFFIEFNRGTLAQARGDHEGAVEALERALALEHTTPERYFVGMSHRMLAQSLMRLGQLDRAIEQARFFLASVEPAPDQPDQLAARAIVAFGEDRPLEALHLQMDLVAAELGRSRERMQRNAAGQAALHNRRLEDIQSTVLREQLANRELQLLQAQQAERNARLFNTLVGVTAGALLVLAGFLFWSGRRFREHARTDALTGIANRRHAMSLAERLFAQSCSGSRPLSLLLLDIDHFKQINDRHGHDVGDRAIRGVVAEVARLLPASAVFGRMGGEEFMIALPDRSHAAALELAESIRREVADHAIDAGGVAVDLTVSIGVAERSAEVPDLDALYRITHQALYAAKHQGRDRIAAGAP